MKRPLATALALAALAGCGGKSSTSPSLTAGSTSGSIPCTAGLVGSSSVAHGTVTAKINGTNWTADCFGVLVTGSTIGISAVDLKATSQILGLGAPKAVGANAVGTGSLVTGHLGLVTTTGNAASWGAQLNTGSGSVQITTLTASSVTGTFTFVMQPLTGSGATGTKTVTDGAFNLTF